MKMKLPDYVSKGMKLLEENGYECYVVGGAVRSFLLRQPVHDYDMTTSALPEEMQAVFRDYKTIETGLKHGTLTVLIDGQPLEITTFRRDSAYPDHRHPETVSFSRAVEEDCARRDFTVNALCYNPADGILDFFGGVKDLKRKILRCIGDADSRFNEDALRILRALRFAARLDFTIEDSTRKALLNNISLLRFVSMERIREELNGFFSAPLCAPYMKAYRAVFTACLPEGKNITDEEWERTLQVIDNTDQPLLRMAVLLACCSSLDAEKTLNELKYSNHEKKQVLNLLQYRRADVSSHTAVRKLLRFLQVPFEDYVSFRKALDPQLDDAAVLAEYHAVIRRHECWQLKDMDISGNDIAALGFRGKEIAEVLEYLLNLVMEDQLGNRRPLLLDAAEAYQKKRA